MLSKGVQKAFQEALGKENVLLSEVDRYAYAYDSAVLPPVLPLMVLRPTTPEALSKAIKICSEELIPITVRGAGTNLSGGTIPGKNSVVILTNGLNRILKIDTNDLYAVVEPGVVTARFAKEVEKQGLFYPPDPGSQAVSTLGGNVAENAGGLRGLKYGVTKDYVLGLEFFDPMGEAIKTGARTVKCVTGYNLSSLLVGSEGTLGVIYRIVLKLIPPPAAKKALVAVFDDMNKASETVAEIIAKKIVPATLEFMDNFTIRAVDAYSKAGLPVDAAAMLLIELDGHPAQVEEDASKIELVCKTKEVSFLRVARDERERDRVWDARRAALSALARLEPTVILEDATVPRSKLPDMVRAIGEISKKYCIKIGTFGHAGDGNLHPTILTNRRDRVEWSKAEKAIEEIFERALALGGTLSGEHGIGLAKADFLEKELGRGTIRYSLAIKKALDPHNLLNPSKLFKGLE